MKRFRKLLVGVVVAIVVVQASTYAAADELDNLRAQAEQEAAAKESERAVLEQHLEGTNAKLRAAVLALHDVEARLPVARAELAQAQATTETAQRDAAHITGRLEQTRAEHEQVAALRRETTSEQQAARAGMAALARQSLKGGDVTTLGILTGAQSTSDFAATTMATAAVARARARIIATCQDAAAQARNMEARLEAIELAITGLQVEADAAVEFAQAAESEAAAQQVKVQTLHQQQTVLTAEIEAQRDAELREIEENIAEQEAIAELIKQLAAQQAERDRVIAERRRAAGLAEGGAFSGFLGWPTADHTVTSSFGWRKHPTLKINRLHGGVDLRAYCGVPIYAAQSGIVVERAWYGTGGNTVFIDHGLNEAGQHVMTRYRHLSGYNVGLNDWVELGQVIGKSGKTGGISTGCHLHFEVYIDGEPVDPMAYLGG
ncbi:MAG: peptidoglycan DD-metalloendopeptidase family protein [Promicromonosporaceae bacterium]|nr:peptidoglycan DD-metalloendopeptidase family protein [Promicromonosporaceae bacterium]